MKEVLSGSELKGRLVVALSDTNN